MLELCTFLFFVVFVLAFIALIGHGLWVAAAALCRAVFGSAAAQESGPSRERCPRCGTHFGRDRPYCPSCSLTMRGPLALELRELEQAARSIQHLKVEGTLDAELAEQVYQRIEARQSQLLIPTEQTEAPRRTSWAPLPLPRRRAPVTNPAPVAASPTLAEPELVLEPVETAAGPAPAALDGFAKPQAEKAPAPPLVTAPPEPQVTWGQMLGRFMEERNILWGELVGGMLIVGCSIALVISLWTTLERIPYFPFLLFAGITTALFGAGLYTLGHWKLEATSRGLLVIATLLVPLDFIVLARVSQDSALPQLDWGVEIVAALAFAWMTWRALRILIGRAEVLGVRRAVEVTAAAIIGAAACQLFVPHWLDMATPHPALFVLLSTTPVLCHALAQGWTILTVTRRGNLTRGAANVLLMTLGLTTFAALVALGFIVYWSEDQTWTLRHLAAPISLLALPLVAGGALLSRRLPVDEATEAQTLSAQQCRLVGTVVALVGMVLMVAALGLGWPRPPALVGVGLVNALVLVGVGLAYRLPVAHVPALVSLAAAFITAYQWATGALSVNDEAELGARLLDVTGSPATALALTILAGLVTAFAELLARADRRPDALVHAAGAGVLAALALPLALLHTITMPWHAAAVFSVIAVGTLLANVRWRQMWLGAVGGVVLLGAVFLVARLLVPVWMLPEIWPLTFCVFTTLLLPAFLIKGADDPRTEEAWHAATPKVALDLALGLPLRVLAMGSSVLAAVTLAANVPPAPLAWDSAVACWLAGLWLFFAWRFEQAGWFAAGQSMLSVAALLGLFAWLDQQEALVRAASLDLQAAAMTLAGLCLTWHVLRTVLPRSTRWHALLNPAHWTVDQIAFFALVFCQLLLAATALAPQVASELRLTPMPEILFSETLAWWLLGGLAMTLVLRLWQPRLQDTVIGSIIVGATVAVLAALACRETNSAASALRWGLALAYVGMSIPLWWRQALMPLAQAVEIQSDAGPDLPRQCRLALIVLTVAPVLLLTGTIAVQGFAGIELTPPEPASWFASLGWVPSMVVPLGLMMLGLLGHGVCEDLPGYVFAAGLVLLGTVPGGYALGLITAGAGIDTPARVFIAQLAGAAASLWLLGWLSTGRWRHWSLMFCQWLLAALFHAALLAVALGGWLVALGGPLPSSVLPTAHWLGWVSLLAWMVAGLWLCELRDPRRSVHVLGIGGLALGILAACLTVNYDATGWLSYHVLTVSWTLTALALLTFSWIGAAAAGLGPLTWPEERRAAVVAWLKQRLPETSARRWVEALGIFVIILAVLGAWGDPTRPYGSAAATLAISLLYGATAVWTRRPGYVYASGALINLAAYLVWQAWLVDVWGVRTWFIARPELFDRLVLLQVLACAFGSAVWSLVEMGLRRHEPPIDVRGRAIPYVHAASLLGLQLLAVYVLVGIGADVMSLDLHLQTELAWPVLGAIAVALFLGFWDPEAPHWGAASAPLYVLGMLGIALALHEQHLDAGDLGWWAGLALGGYALVVSVLARLPVPIDRWLGWPAQTESRWSGWLAPMQIASALTALGLSLWVVNTFPSLAERAAGALMAALASAALACLVGMGDKLAPRSEDKAVRPRITGLATMVLCLGVLVGIELLWAFVAPGGPTPWLQRTAGLLLVLAVAAPFHDLLLARKLDPVSAWATAAARLGKPLTCAGVAVLLVLLVQELALYDSVVRTTPLTFGWMLAVAGMLLAYMVGAVTVAVAPRLDPFGLSSRGRVASIWLAELLLGLTLLHLRLNVPDIFPSFLGQYWALMVMTLGFVGVACGELFRRRDLPMLAEPLFRTGLVLPMVPLLAYLIKPLSGLAALGDAIPGLQPLLGYLDRLPDHYGMHTALWFLLGLLYGLTAVLRRSSWYGLAAALACNFGLWVIYAQHPDLAFTLHPQVWLAPLGLLVLVAERLHGGQLHPAQAQATRYAGLLMIYVSSAADLFITGLGESVVLPIVLALLAVLGVLAGILLRVRAFLFCGVAFLGLVIFSQIWHAAVQRAHVWVWWACGIVLGALILALFAVFEKRRLDVLRLLEDFRQWR